MAHEVAPQTSQKGMLDNFTAASGTPVNKTSLLKYNFLSATEDKNCDLGTDQYFNTVGPNTNLKIKTHRAAQDYASDRNQLSKALVDRNSLVN